MLSFWQTDCSAETSLQERERRKSRFFVRLPPRSAIASTTADVCWHVSPYPGQRLGRGKYLHDDDAVCSSPTPPPRGDAPDVAPVKRELPAEQLGEERFCANAHRDDQADDWGCPHPAYLHCWSGIFILLLVGDIHPRPLFPRRCLRLPLPAERANDPDTHRGETFHREKYPRRTFCRSAMKLAMWSGII